MRSLLLLALVGCMQPSAPIDLATVTPGIYSVDVTVDDNTCTRGGLPVTFPARFDTDVTVTDTTVSSMWAEASLSGTSSLERRTLPDSTDFARTATIPMGCDTQEIDTSLTGATSDTLNGTEVQTWTLQSGCTTPFADATCETAIEQTFHLVTACAAPCTVKSNPDTSLYCSCS